MNLVRNPDLGSGAGTVAGGRSGGLAAVAGRWSEFAQKTRLKIPKRQTHIIINR